MKRRSYLIMGSHNPNTAEQVSAFFVTSQGIEGIAKQWLTRFPYVSYFAINHKRSRIHCEREEKKND